MMLSPASSVWRQWAWSSVALLSAGVFVLIVISNLEDEGERQFKDFLRKYGRFYLTRDKEEYTKRLNIFKQALLTIENLNSGRNSPNAAVYGVTKFSDMTPEEFQVQLLQFKTTNKTRNDHHKHHHSRRATDTLPNKVDWRSKGVVTPIKNQKDCGACWAFSVVETVETMSALQKGSSLEELSVQQVIDCAQNGNHGCNGGDTCSVLEWLSEANVNITKEKDYPLTLDRDSTCKTRPSAGVRISPRFTCENLVGSEDDMIYRLATHGPLVTAIDAQTWQYYLGGIIQFHCEQNINHAVQVVGYDKSAAIPHYIVRNSWGEDFGNQGYLNIAIGSNLCGIAREVSVLSVL